VYNTALGRLALKFPLFSASWVSGYQRLRLPALNLRRLFAYSLSAMLRAICPRPPRGFAGFR